MLFEQSMKPIEVATMVHALFTKFDQAVQVSLRKYQQKVILSRIQHYTLFQCLQGITVTVIELRSPAVFSRWTLSATPTLLLVSFPLLTRRAEEALMLAAAGQVLHRWKLFLSIAHPVQGLHLQGALPARPLSCVDDRARQQLPLLLALGV